MKYIIVFFLAIGSFAFIFLDGLKIVGIPALDGRIFGENGAGAIGPMLLIILIIIMDVRAFMRSNNPTLQKFRTLISLFCILCALIILLVLVQLFRFNIIYF